MCGRYQFSSKENHEMQQIARDAERHNRDQFNKLHFPIAGDIAPTQIALVLFANGNRVISKFQR